MEQPSAYIEIPEKPHPKTKELLSELLMIIPNSIEYSQNTEINPDSTVVKIHEDIGPQFIIFTNKTNQFVFKIIEYRSRSSMGITSEIKKENSQLVLSHFNTELGLKVADFFMSVFPINLESNQAINFTVHKDFIFFRMYRFCVTEKGPIFEKLGPHLTLRLWRIVDICDNEKKIYKYEKYIKNANIL